MAEDPPLLGRSVSSELDWERETLAKSRQDIAAGEERVERQMALVGAARARGLDAVQAERLLELLRDTLEGWRQHHVQIVDRIAYLEEQQRLAGAT